MKLKRNEVYELKKQAMRMFNIGYESKIALVRVYHIKETLIAMSFEAVSIETISMTVLHSGKRESMSFWTKDVEDIKFIYCDIFDLGTI